ncbi:MULTISPECIES: hypothetical protein [unclassified Psychrobacter]|uniref:hypothetical protein n=1 Tax=unclassified Psychrobacter TaxID=196806 RepID=UPI0025B43ED3|nr:MULTISPECIES: hypothetical protein [unclassified Psychrobacter]MDN3452180.1 hypothetical protein [Psychrobacter sp. APC 3350]MDN3501239.1 hypothetical protein [Psychrobacter sp. 5A.1]
MATTNDTIEKNGMAKSWLTIGLVAAALTLSACGKKDEAPMEAEPAADAQTAVEEDAASVGNDDIAVASADDGMAVGDNDDVAVATADDTEMLDGTESEEHISTN